MPRFFNICGLPRELFGEMLLSPGKKKQKNAKKRKFPKIEKRKKTQVAFFAPPWGTPGSEGQPNAQKWSIFVAEGNGPGAERNL